MDDCCCIDFQNKVHYAYVGDKRGRYDLRGGTYVYVGHQKGSYEKQELPIDYTRRLCVLCACLVLAGIALVFLVRWLTPVPMFDCYAGWANWENGWSNTKKVWCCEAEGMGCSKTDAVPVGPEAPPPPHWLNMWLPDMRIGSKFIFSSFIFCVTGCCCGGLLMYFYARYIVRQPPAKTQLELITEAHRRVARDGGHSGELTLTLLWDTTDDLDMELELPRNKGRICHHSTEVAGGRMDVDRNSWTLSKKQKHFPPVENITWEPFDIYAGMNPPEGEYTLKVRVLEKHDHSRAADITVVKSQGGTRKLWHYRLVPGCDMLTVCTFQYSAPRKLPEEEEAMFSVLAKRAQHDAHKLGVLHLALIWDTQDDLDLKLLLPNGSVVDYSRPDNPEACGAALDQDVKELDFDGRYRMERIYWSADQDLKLGPPSGAYRLTVTLFERKVKGTINFMVMKTVAGKREVHRHAFDPEDKDHTEWSKSFEHFNRYYKEVKNR